MLVLYAVIYSILILFMTAYSGIICISMINFFVQNVSVIRIDLFYFDFVHDSLSRYYFVSHCNQLTTAIQ